MTDIQRTILSVLSAAIFCSPLVADEFDDEFGESTPITNDDKPQESTESSQTGGWDGRAGLIFVRSERNRAVALIGDSKWRREFASFNFALDVAGIVGEFDRSTSGSYRNLEFRQLSLAKSFGSVEMRHGREVPSGGLFSQLPIWDRYSGTDFTLWPFKVIRRGILQTGLRYSIDNLEVDVALFHGNRIHGSRFSNVAVPGEEAYQAECEIGPYKSANQGSGTVSYSGDFDIGAYGARSCQARVPSPSFIPVDKPTSSFGLHLAAPVGNINLKAEAAYYDVENGDHTIFGAGFEFVDLDGKVLSLELARQSTGELDEYRVATTGTLPYLFGFLTVKASLEWLAESYEYLAVLDGQANVGAGFILGIAASHVTEGYFTPELLPIRTDGAAMSASLIRRF
jgi:hypothetical protein